MIANTSRVRAAFALAATVVVASAGCGSAPGARVPERSNVLLITVDTLRRDALGWVSKANDTPALDGLAASGVRFTTAIASTPLTLPSHTTLLTGLYPPRNGVRDNGQLLAGDIPTLAESLREAGYRTAAFVSGFPLQAMFGLDRGFEHYDDELPGEDEGLLERPADLTTAAALEWIRGAESPWFVWVHYYDPHAPYDPPRAFWRPGPRGPYDGEVAFTDDAIGDLLTGIPEDDAGRTLTVFTADHGESFGEHDESDHGVFLYDTTVAVPLVFHYPGALTAGERPAVPSLADVTPTVLKLLELPVPVDLDGEELTHVLAGERMRERSIYLETRFPWNTYGWAPLRGLRNSDWKLVEAPRPELYDLRADPGETHDLAADRPDVVESLLAELEALADETSAPASETLTDPEVLAKLEALGYVSGGHASPDPAADLIDPKDRTTERILLLAGESMLRAKDYARALATFEEVLFNDPENRFALLRTGLAHTQSGSPERAIAFLERAVDADPEQPEPQYALADALTRTGRYADAIPHWQETLRLQPRRVAAWSNLGSTLGWAGRLEASIAAFEEAVRLEPRRSDLWVNLAFAEHAAGRAPDAITHLERAADTDPATFRLASRLGLYLFEAGRVDPARDWLTRSNPGDPDFPEGRLALAKIDLMRGDEQSARSALDAALRLAPELRSRVLADRELARLIAN